MLLWLIFAVMSAAVVAMLMHPLLARPPTEATSAEGTSAVYRDQLAEIDTEQSRGLIGEDEAEFARREIARRLIASADANDGQRPSALPYATPLNTATAASVAAAPPPRRGAAVVSAFAIAAVVPLVALGLYLVTGAPGVPSQPLAERQTTPTVPAETASLVAAVEARLKQDPEDGRGWDVIAPVYMRLARYPEAAHAFDRALRLLGETPRRLAGKAEALMLSDDGKVSVEARAALTRVLELEPANARARFWLAFANEQDGRFAEAVDAYEKLLADLPADVGWRPMLQERHQVARAALQAGSAGAAVATPSAEPTPPASAAQAPQPPAPTSPPGPSAADITAAEKMTPADRQAMIEDMVAGLAARLETNGRDLAGWQRLIRSLTVLGRKDDAVAALARARQSFADEPASLAALTDLASNLGLGS